MPDGVLIIEAAPPRTFLSSAVLHVSVATTPPALAGASARSKELWMNSAPQAVPMFQLPYTSTGLRSAPGRVNIVSTRVADADRVLMGLPGASVISIREPAGSGFTVLNRFDTPGMAQVVQALRLCAQQPGRTGAIVAAAGARRPDAPRPDRPAAAPADDGAVPVWLVPPRVDNPGEPPGTDPVGQTPPPALKIGNPSLPDET